MTDTLSDVSDYGHDWHTYSSHYGNSHISIPSFFLSYMGLLYMDSLM